MEQMTLMVAIIAFIYISYKTGVGFYKIVASFLTLALAITMVTEPLLFGVFIITAIYLFVSVFTKN